MRKVGCLVRRSGVFYFRKAIPQRLRYWLGCREYVQSLRTRDPKLAARRALDMAEQLEAILARVRLGAELLSQAELYVGVALPTDPANSASTKHQLSSDYAKAVALEAAKHDQPIGIIKLKAEAERYVKPLTEREIKRLEKLQREAETAIVY